MAVSIQSAQSIFSNTEIASVVPATTEAFYKLSVEDQLALLWYAYTEMGVSITAAAPGVASMALVEGVLNDIKLMSPAEQSKTMFDLASNADTSIGRLPVSCTI